MIKRLLVALSLVPVLCFGAEYSASLTAIENLLSSINHSLRGDGHDYPVDMWGLLDQIAHHWDSFSVEFDDLMDYVSTIETSTHQMENKLVQVSGKLADVYTRLGYINSTCTSILTNLNQALTYYDAINGSVSRIARDIGVYGDAILTAFSTLQTTVSNIDTNVDSIDDTTRELLQAVIALSVVTNQRDGVVYDFSKLTNNFGAATGVVLQPRGLTWYNVLDLDSLVFTTDPQANIPLSLITARADLATYLRQLFYNTYASSFIERNILKSSAIVALSSVSVSNNVGRLVVQGNTVTNCLQWSTNYFATILNPLVNEIATNTADIVECQRVITNLLADISSRISSVTNGSDEAEAKVEAEVTKAEEGLDNVDEPPDPDGFEFHMFQVQGHENFISSIPEGDTLPSVLKFDFEWQEEHHHFEVAVFSYANVFGLFRLAFTALYWGATFFLLLYLTMIVYRLVRWLVSMFGAGSSAG